MAKLRLLAAFWETGDVSEADYAVVHLQDGVAVHITRFDGLQVRLSIHQMDTLYDFVIDEILKYEEARRAGDLHSDGEEE